MEEKNTGASQGTLGLSIPNTLRVPRRLRARDVWHARGTGTRGR